MIAYRLMFEHPAFALNAVNSLNDGSIRRDICSY